MCSGRAGAVPGRNRGFQGLGTGWHNAAGNAARRVSAFEHRNC